jgi:hypothetical protein
VNFDRGATGRILAMRRAPGELYELAPPLDLDSVPEVERPGHPHHAS